jgi:hypothetical protein
MARIKCSNNSMKSLLELMSIFHDQMLIRLSGQDVRGWHGWSDKKAMAKYKGGLKARIIKNAQNGDWVDVANLAMFAWNLEK